MNHRVELRSYSRELHNFRLRLAIGAGFMLLLFLLLFTRFFYLQVSQREHYHTLAEANRISIAPIVPNRGLIFDRNGVVLAHNYSAYTLEIVPSKTGNYERLINELTTVVEISGRDRKRFKKLMEENRRFESLPIRTRLSDVEVARFAANRYRFPGVEIKARPFRQYPKGELASHVVGYIGRINDKDLERLEADSELANYRGSQHMGKIGIEQSYERELHGITGVEEMETDAAGRAIRVISRTPPTPGKNLKLSLDSKLQEVAEKAFGDRRGALVAIEPATGDVLAFVSRPGFDPNLFVDGIDTENWELLNNSIDRPLNNRALRGLYPPGSTFKPFMALAGLELKKRWPGSAISDPGYFSLPGSTHRFRDWKAEGHGLVDLHKSLVISCDTYYYSLAHDLGIDNIYNFTGQFGLGKKTGIDIEGEVSGLLPSQAWKMQRHKEKWVAGDTISVGIGQGYNLATPLQMAFATAVLASNGTAFRPHLVKQVLDSNNRVVREFGRSPLYRLKLDPANLKAVHNALVDVTRPGGTAAVAGAGAAYAFAGKTGTAQVVGVKQGEKYEESKLHERHRDHALFVSYAPAENPKIALSVLVENGGHGGAAAAPIARVVMDYYLLGKLPKEAAAQPVDQVDEEEDEEHQQDGENGEDGHG